MWQTASMLLAEGAQAQGSTCDSFKARLSERIEASGVRGYSLEIISSGTPMPRDGKVVGTCEGGARKIVYRRWGESKAPAEAMGAEASAPAPTVLQAPAPPVATVRAEPARAAASQAAPTRATAGAVRPAPTPAVVASAVPARAADPVKPVSDQTSEPPAVAANDRSAAQPPSVQAEKTDVPRPSLARRAVDVIADHWRWMLLLALLPLLGWLWAWQAHRNAYDEAGLPRGPKL